MIATVISGEVDLADVFMLVAVILAAISTFLNVVRGAAEAALLPAAVGFLAAALLVL